MAQRYPGWLLVLWLLGISLTTQAVIEAYPFADDALRQRYQALVAELRCPKCQNQNLADSDAPIAKDLRAEVYRLLHEQQSDQQIKDYLVARYGEFVLYRPPLNSHTALLWLAPLGLLLAVVPLLWWLSRRRRQQPSTAVDSSAVAAILAEQQERQ